MTVEHSWINSAVSPERVVLKVRSRWVHTAECGYLGRDESKPSRLFSSLWLTKCVYTRLPTHTPEQLCQWAVVRAINSLMIWMRKQNYKEIKCSRQDHAVCEYSSGLKFMSLSGLWEVGLGEHCSPKFSTQMRHPHSCLSAASENSQANGTFPYWILF